MKFLDREIVSVHAAALVLGGAGMLSRVLGVLRDRLLSGQFGAGRELDIYYAAFQIPDFMAAVFLLGGASAAVLPVFQEYAGWNPALARRFIRALALAFLAGAGVLSLAAFAVSPFLIPLLTPGFSAREQELVSALTRIMLVSPVLLGLSGIFSAVVQARKRFFAYAAAPIFYNAGIIAGILFLVPGWGVIGLGGGVALGALLHLATQWAGARPVGFPETRSFLPVGIGSLYAEQWKGIRAVAALALPRALALSLTQITLLVFVAIASLFSAGTVAVFMLAQNLFFVPIGVFGLSYAVALFPRLSGAALCGSGDEFFAGLRTGVRGILFWVAPAAALTVVLRAHIVRAALGTGAFSWEDTRLTAAALAVLAAAMAAGALQTLFIRAFYALGETRRPLAAGACASVFSVALALGGAALLMRNDGMGLLLAQVFRIADLPHREVLGLALGFSGGMIVYTALLWRLLLSAVERRFGMGHDRSWSGRELWHIAAAAMAAGAAAYAVRASFSEVLPLITFVRVLAQGAAAAAAGLVVYWAILLWLGNEEVAVLRRHTMRRLFSLRILPAYWDVDTK